jgi:HK97 family phage major capsid protein
MALAVANPNFLDVMNACVTDIATTHNYEDEMPYLANLVMINPIDFYLNLTSAKDGDGKPLYPTASLFSQVNIGGITVIPEESIPSGKIFVADMSKYNTTDYVGYTVKIGFVNDDFIKNQFVILGESRFHAFVKKLDEQAFIYDDIATIKTAITEA